MAHVVLAGASGFLGSHLRETLVRRGHTVTALVRRPARDPGESAWDPYAAVVEPRLIESADVVVNLAGSPTLGNPHSRRWSQALEESRVATTRTLASAIGRSERRPALLAGNAVGWYGDHGDAALTEAADTRGHSLMTQVCRAWQDATRPAADAGARVCLLRTAPVMDADAAPLRQLRLLFRAGLGARVGDGRQRMPMVSLRDWLGGVVHLVEHQEISGPVNLCCVRTPTNAEFTRALAEQVHRPALLRAPKAVLRVAAGRLSPELLGSVNVVPRVLLDAGYRFRDPDVTAVLAAGLSRARD